MKVLRLFPALLALLVSVSVKAEQRSLPDSASVADVARFYCDSLYEDALAIADSLARADSLDDAAHYYRGRCLQALGRGSEAAAEFTKAVRLSPGNYWYYEPLVEHYYNTGNRWMIEETCLQLREHFPNRYTTPFIRTILVDAYKRRGNMPAFFTEMREIVKDDSIEPRMKADCVDEILHGCDAQTYRYWHAQLDSLVDLCTSLHPSDTSMLKMAGLWYYGTAQKEKAKELFADWLKAYPRDPSIHELLLEIAAMEGDRQEVISQAQTIMEIDPSRSVQMYSVMGDQYYEMGERRRCYSCYEKALKINPHYAPVLNNYAYFLSLEKKRLRKAEKMSLDVVSQYPDNATYLDTYAWVLHLRGKDAEAKAVFKRAVIYGGKENSAVLEHYAEVLESLGEAKLASYYRGLAASKSR